MVKKREGRGRDRGLWSVYTAVLGLTQCLIVCVVRAGAGAGQPAAGQGWISQQEPGSNSTG